MSSIRYSPEALADLERTLGYVTNDLDSPIAAKKLVQNIMDSISTLSRFPNSGERLDNYVSVKTDYRRLVCGNYLVFYRIEKEVVHIVRIIHGGRNYARILFGDVQINIEETEN